MDATVSPQKSEIFPAGTPISKSGVGGFIAAYRPGDGARSFMLSCNSPIYGDYVVVWGAGHITELPDVIARGYASEAIRAGLAFEPEHAALYAAALQKQQEDRTKAARDREETAAKRRAFVADAAARMPAWAKAVIVAELMRDECDSMTDYFASSTTRRVILAWSPHTRDVFAEMRKAARHFPDTAHLADGPDTFEHREKYSMGAGYYLKDGYRHDDGWRVYKVRLHDKGAEAMPDGEWHIPAPEIAAKPTEREATRQDNGGMQIEEHIHSKHSFAMWIVVLADRVSRDEFDRLNREAKALRGWYSRPWQGTPGGFAFKVKENAEAFAGMSPGGDDPDDKGKPDDVPAKPEAPRAAPAIGDKLRTLANAMQGEIDRDLGDRLANTPKRQRQAAQARLNGRMLRRAQKGLRVLADHHDAGTVPDALRTVTTKARALALAASRIDQSNAGYYDAGIDTETPYLSTPDALAFWQMIGTRSEAERRVDDLKRQIEALQFAKIAGYFPTPRAVVRRMLDHAAIRPGMLILEPSAGAGNILDSIAADEPGARLVALEQHHALAAIIKAKGYEVDHCDFTEREPEAVFDRVIMNPPFENGQDAAHVRLAYAHLKPGGRLVAIMSPGPFFRSDERSRSFRRWFEESGGEKYDLPAGSFKESGTDVATVLVVIGKE